MSVKAKYIKDLPLKNELDGSESLLLQDSNGTKQAPLGTIVDEIKQNSQEKIREIESEFNAQLSQVANKGTTVEVLERVTKEEIERQIEDGRLTNLTIEDNSITGEKIKDKTISNEKLTFIQDDNVKNICDYSLFKDNALLNNAGSVEDNIDYYTFIFKVEPNTPYSFSVLGNELLAVSKVVQKEHYYLDDFRFISNHINVDKVVTANNCNYLAMSLHKPSVELSYGNFEDFKNNKFFVQKGETPTPVTQPKLVGIRVEYLESEIENLKNSNVEIRVEHLESEIENLKNSNVEIKTNLFNDHLIKENTILNNVGWVENNDSTFTIQKGIKVEEGSWYAFSYEDFPIQASAISFKTADDLDAYVQSTLIQRDIGKVYIKAPDNAEYMFLSFPNMCKENLNELKVTTGVSALDLSVKTALFNKKIMTLGDSLTELGLWQSYVAGKLGVREIVNLGVGGITVNRFIENVTSENLSDVDFVTMMGFFNSNTVGCVAGDITDEPSNEPTSSIIAQYKFNIEKILQLNPKVRIVIMSPHRPRANDCLDKVEAVEKVAKYYGLPFIDIYNEGGFNSLTYSQYLIDAVHSSFYKNGGYHKESELITGKLISYFG